MKIILAFCVCALFGGMASGAPNPDPGLRFLEERVKGDPDDIVAQNQLADRYLAKMRVTGRLEWLPKARTAVEASLRSVPGEMNAAGLSAAARVALAEHRFAEAEKLAQHFTELRPMSASGWETLFDAQLELGAYAEAAKALEQLKLKGGDPVSVGSREAQWARIHGEDAAIPLEAAIASLRAAPARRAQPDALVWCLVQRGEVAFALGDFVTADRCYTEALAASPDDWRAQSHVAELRAAEGKYDEGLALLTKCIEATGRPELLQAAGDMELARQRPEAAKEWHDRALAAYRASLDRGEKLYVHHLAGFYCDVRPQAADAVRLARADLAERQGIYAHAALAWALHLDGKMEEAVSETTAALATHTRDAHVLYQAGMIFTAAGDLARGRTTLRAAEAANPKQSCFHFHR